MENEKEEYREKIIDMVNEIEDVNVLIYLNTFISEKFKAEQ